MNFVTFEDLDALAWGAALLGSGGGGDVTYELMMAKHALEIHGPVKLLKLDQLKDSDFVLPLAFMGAPCIGQEKIPGGHEYQILYDKIKQVAQREPTVLLADEIGGANVFTPLIMASITGLPVLDADNIGRAFPELQMSTCTLKNILPTPALLVGSLGEVITIETRTAVQAEHVARAVTIELGSSALLSMYWMTGQQARSAVVTGSISYACKLGKVLLDAQKNKRNPAEALLEATPSKLLGSGIVTTINHCIQDGFLRGQATIQTLESAITLEYQNENLLARAGDKVLATTPDIIIPLHAQTGKPLTTDTLMHGMRVHVVTLPAPAIWQTEAGIALVGPRYFGYNVDYTSSFKN